MPYYNTMSQSCQGYLYKKNICTTDMLYGQQNENVAKSMFMQQYNKTVRPSGLFIEEFGCLAGSPDGKFFFINIQVFYVYRLDLIGKIQLFDNCWIDMENYNTSYKHEGPRITIQIM
ncbi:hypothetical protein PYW07_010108 [Mythimna separata]|uniref:Uncharacterized protein n=1 Tax=Mythimna separata TaxID=271217 RepID=A0AAD7YIF4_MYTSE|nr:hypothetical protein PYW07_010108 [Mythimna separata]